MIDVPCSAGSWDTVCACVGGVLWMFVDIIIRKVTVSMVMWGGTENGIYGQ